MGRACGEGEGTNSVCVWTCRVGMLVATSRWRLCRGVSLRGADLARGISGCCQRTGGIGSRDPGGGQLGGAWRSRGRPGTVCRDALVFRG